MKISKIKGEINLPAKASIYYFSASAIGKMIGILMTPLFTRLMTKEDYGEMTLYMTLLGISSLLCSAVSSGSGIYVGLKRNEDKKEEFIKSSILSSFLFCLVICLLLFTFSPYLGLSRAFLPPLMLQVICDGLVGVTLCKEKFYYNYKRVVIIYLVSSVAPALSYLILLFLRFNWKSRIYSMLITSLIITIIQLARVYRMPGRAKIKTAIYSFSLTLPLLPQGIYSAITSQTDKLFIKRYIGTGALAKYSVVHSLGVAFQFGVSALFSSLGPWIIRRLVSEDKKIVTRVISAVYLLFTSLSLILISLSPEAMKILAPGEYSEALPALVPIALSVPLAIISSAINIILVHSGKGRYTTLISLFGLALCLSLNYTLIPRFGYIGAGLSTLITQSLQVILGIMIVTKKGFDRIINVGFIGIVYIVSALVAFLLYLGYGIIQLRAALLIIPILAILICIYRSMEFIKE